MHNWFKRLDVLVCVYRYVTPKHLFSILPVIPLLKLVCCLLFKRFHQYIVSQLLSYRYVVCQLLDCQQLYVH